jgi:hypothetical protein
MLEYFQAGFQSVQCVSKLSGRFADYPLNAYKIVAALTLLNEGCVEKTDDDGKSKGGIGWLRR